VKGSIMTNWNRKARWMTGSLVVAGTLVLAGCNSKDKGTTPTPTSSAATNATDSQTSSVRDDAAAASATAAAEDMHNRMETDQRQRMDHDNMRMGPGMNHPASPAPSTPPADPAAGMQGGGMKDM
jgi:outer membrane murein-binding lipoprotein Lpp